MKLLFDGDVMLGRLVNEVLKKEKPEYPWGNTTPIFRNADLRIINLECVISDRGEPWSITPKMFHFRSDKNNIEVLKKANINLASLANNHALDFGYTAMFEMIKILDGEKILHSGAGKNILETQSPAICEVQEKKVGMISCTDNEPDWEATEKNPGIFFVPIDLEDERAKTLFDLIQATKKKVDILIVSCHWGPNWGYRPQPHHIPFSYRLIDSGADIIFGHSCHVFQGIEFYKRKPILFSTGDFIDDYAVDEIERNDQSFIFLVEIEEKGISRLRLYPTIISNFQAILPPLMEAREIAEKMKALCGEFKTKTKWREKEGYLEVYS